MLKKFISVILIMCPSVVFAWEFKTITDAEGDFYLVEQIGEAGLFLSIECDAGVITAQVEFPEGDLDDGDGALLFQIDGNPEFLLSGFFDPVAHDTTLFIGIDRSDKPALTTTRLVNQARSGNHLYLGDPDLQEAFERWPLAGFTKAMNSMMAACKT